MQKWKSNWIVEAIKTAGLDPRQFDLQEEDGIVRIKYKWSPSCFSIGSKGAHSTASCVVGDGGEWPISAYSWQTISPRISSWLAEVKHDLDTPDYGLNFNERHSCSARFPMTSLTTRPSLRTSKRRLRHACRHWLSTRGTHTVSRHRRRAL